MASSPSIPEAPIPAVKPERQVDIAPEDIALGGSQNLQTQEGKRQLKRPRSAAGTGLSV